MKGYVGKKLLRVDLTTGTLKEERLSDEILKNYIGGSGLGAKLLFDEVPPRTNPLGPENKLYLLTGPITGTGWPTSGRTCFVTKGALTDIFAESHVGGFLGPELKYAGFDALAIEGASETPVYLYLHDGNAALHDASHLWGRDTYEASTMLLEETHKDAQLAVIGPAGEKLVRFASVIVNYARAAGRTGVGAVMGSKKLKALVVKGTGFIEVADLNHFRELMHTAHHRVVTNPQAMDLRTYGTPLLVAIKNEIGELVTKNHQTGVFPFHEKLEADTLRENYWVKTRACAYCSVGCKKEYEVKDGQFPCRAEGPEYEAIYSFGTNCWNSDFGSILQANLLANKYGLDSISTGCVIAFAMELWERGLLTKEDTDGLDLSWGNAAAIVTLVTKIAMREGFGDLLAEGSWRAAEKIGKNADQSTVTVKKMEISGQDGRTHRSMALGHATAARGGDHLRSLITIDQLGYQDIAAARFGADKLPEICDPYLETHKALATKITEDIYALRDTLLVCWYTCSWPPIFWLEDFGPALVAVTGEPAFGNKENLVRIAERIVVSKRLFNIREGLTRSDDQLPPRFFAPMPEGPGKGQVVNLEIMLDEYYALRGWNANGIPTHEVLARLGLNDVVTSSEETGIL